MEEWEFQHWYGSFAPLSPARVAAWFDGASFPWWVAGGWAIDAFTGSSRDHEDVDIAVFRANLPAVRQQLSGLHLWAAIDGTLRPLLPDLPEPEAYDQIWVRRNAFSPWLFEVLLTPGDGDAWVNKRDAGKSIPLDEATFLAADGVRYLAPELVLVMKAKHSRRKDDDDLARALPLLDTRQRQRLREWVAQLHPGHG